MAQTIKEWIETEVTDLQAAGVGEISDLYFHRDPNVPRIVNYNLFFTPASGIILYQKEVKPNEKIIDIKGKNFTLKDLMQDDEWDEPALVIGIFMTMYDVHVNRMPYNGVINSWSLDTIQTRNFPMLNIEKDLIEKGNFQNQDLDYLFWNERTVNSVFIPNLNYTYYMVQIADLDVDVIYSLVAEGSFVGQNTRFGGIRYGSQVDLILPLPAPFEYKKLNKNKMHVEVGVDPLLEIKLKKSVKKGEKFQL